MNITFQSNHVQRELLTAVIMSIFCILVSSCTSDESKAKKTVKAFCEAYKIGQTDQIHALYPEFTYGIATADQIDLENLKATQEGKRWEVEDGANHIFYVEESKGDFLIKDSKNVIFWEGKLNGHVTAAKWLGMVTGDSTDIEKLKAYAMLRDGSPLIEFLKMKYPEAMVYGVTVDKVQKKIEGCYGIYWIEAQATLKSGRAKPIGPVSVVFIFKDKDGNEITREENLVTLSANNTKVVERTADLNDYPNIKDVSVELEPYERVKGASDIDILCAYTILTQADYQEFLDSSRN